ncbi:MAG: hypothetical protein LLG14_16900 [Nocardiaceae bacterium]|nr:hypothetical protein [Nocardiaceae bacterium]
MIDIPEPLKWVGTFMFIGDFPDSNEDLLAQMSTTYDQVAAEVRRLSDELRADANQLSNALEGQAADAIIKVLNDVATGEDTGLADLAEQLAKAGNLLEVTGYQVIATKLIYIGELIYTAINIAIMLAAAAETFGASLAEIPVTTAITRVVLTQVIKQLVREILESIARNAVKRIAFNAAEGMGEAVILETARQAVEKNVGFRESYDLGKIAQAAAEGAAEGAVEGVAESAGSAIKHHNRSDTDSGGRDGRLSRADSPHDQTSGVVTSTGGNQRNSVGTTGNSPRTAAHDSAGPASPQSGPAHPAGGEQPETAASDRVRSPESATASASASPSAPDATAGRDSVASASPAADHADAAPKTVSSSHDAASTPDLGHSTDSGAPPAASQGHTHSSDVRPDTGSPDAGTAVVHRSADGSSSTVPRSAVPADLPKTAPRATAAPTGRGTEGPPTGGRPHDRLDGSADSRATAARSTAGPSSNAPNPLNLATEGAPSPTKSEHTGRPAPDSFAHGDRQAIHASPDERPASVHRSPDDALQAANDTWRAHLPQTLAAAKAWHQSVLRGESPQARAELSRDLATAAMRHVDYGDADRVVFGPYKGPDAGYIGEAKKNGGIYFDMAEAWGEALGDLDGNDIKVMEKMFEPNREVIRIAMERGVDRIEFHLDGRETVDAILAKAEFTGEWPYRAMEVRAMKELAGQYGYVQAGNTWRKVR